MTRPEKGILRLECKLTDTEMLAYAKEMGDKLSQLRRLEASKQSYNKQIASEISSAEARVAALSESVSSGKEYRDVECRIRYNFDTKEKIWVRTDTFDVAHTDIISESELQEEADLQADKIPDDRQTEMPIGATDPDFDVEDDTNKTAGKAGPNQ